MINRDDFQYMWRGKATRPLPASEEKRLHPIDKRSKDEKYGRALLLLHGFSSTPAVYRELIPKLKFYDALVCPALPGHAESLEAFSQVTHEQWLSSVKEVCESLIKQYQSVEVVGLSLGGLLACHIAHELPIQKLYLLAPALKLRFNITLGKYIGNILRCFGKKYLKAKAGNLHTHAFEELTYKKMPIRTLLEILNFVEQTKFKAPPCKTELFLGVHDEVVDSSEVAKLFEGNDRCTTHWLDRTAHVMPLDGDIETLSEYINDRKSYQAEPS